MEHLRAFVERDHGDTDGPLRITAATEGRKADGLDLRMDRVRLDRWRSNPVVLLEHFPITLGASMPAVIGRADDIGVDDDRLRADVTFDTANQLAAEIDRQYRDGFLHAFSIGFDHGEVDRNGIPEWWEPVEVSSVPVPMDGGALADDDSRDQLVTVARAAIGDHDVARNLRQLLTPTRAGAPSDREAIPAHSTSTDTDSEWDGQQAVADAPNDAEVLRYMHAWVDGDGDPDAKNSYSLPHHGPRTDAPANIAGVNNALARLAQSNIPSGDQDAVERHLRDHREDAGLDRAMSDDEVRAVLADTFDREARIREPAKRGGIDSLRRRRAELAERGR